MPAKPKAVKKPAKPASNTGKPATAGKAAKPAVKATKTKTAPAAKKATAPATKKPSPKAAKPAKPSSSGSKTAAPAKKAAPAKSKPAAPAAKKTAVPAAASKTPKAAPPALKEKNPAKKAAAPSPAPAPAKAAKPAPAKAEPAKAAKGKSAAPKGSGAAPALSKGFNAGPHLTPVARRPVEDNAGATIEVPKVVKQTPFLKRQRQRLLELRSLLLDSMESVADGSLRSRPEGSEASAFGQHMADAGSDAYDRDFALSLLSQEQDSLYEINEALKRVDIGTYGICEMSGKPIPEVRLEALPFTRFTVECQAQLEREGMGGRHRRPVRSLFGLEGENEGESESEEEEDTETVDNKQE